MGNGAPTPPLPPGASYAAGDDDEKRKKQQTTPPLPAGASYPKLPSGASYPTKTAAAPRRPGGASGSYAGATGSWDEPTKGEARTTGLLYGLLDPAYTAEQIGAREYESEQQTSEIVTGIPRQESRIPEIDKRVVEREKRYEAEPSVKAHPDWAFWGGRVPGAAVSTAVSNPVLTAIPGAGETLPIRAALAAGVGGPLAVTSQPVTKGFKESEGIPPVDYFNQQLENYIGGTVGGAVLEPIGEGLNKVFVGATKAGLNLVNRAGRWMFESPEQRVATKAAATAGKEAQREAKFKAKGYKEVQKAITETQQAGRLDTNEILKQFQEAEESGQPFVLMDVDRKAKGGPIERLAGSVYRGPGKAGAHMGGFQEERTGRIDEETQRTAQNLRLYDRIRSFLKTPARDVMLKLASDRSASHPLWDKAMEGGNIAPLEKQFENEFSEAGARVVQIGEQVKSKQRELLQWVAREHQMGDNVYGVNSAREEQARIKNELRPLQEQLKDAMTEKAQAELKMRISQDHAEMQRLGQMRGAVWSPKLQRVFQNKYVRRGLALAATIEKNEADAANRPFNLSEYAIVGFEGQEAPKSTFFESQIGHNQPELERQLTAQELPQGAMPITDRVYNMKAIQMAKQGLDEILYGSDDATIRDPRTGNLTKLGKSIQDLRDTLVSEADRLNPDWAPARRAWASPTEQMQLLRDGKFAAGRHTENNWSISLEELQDRWGKMSETEREVFKIGYIDKMIEDLDAARAGDATKTIQTLQSAEDRSKFKTLFDTEEEFQRTMRFINRERAIYESEARVMGGSQTAERAQAETNRAITAGTHAGHGAMSLVTGHPVSATRSFLAAGRELGHRHDREVNLAIAKILTDPNIRAQLWVKDGNLMIGTAPVEKAGASFGQRAIGAAAGDIGAQIGGGLFQHY